MSNQYTLKFSSDKAKEMPMVDLAFEVLKAANNPFYYRDLMQEIANIKGISDDQVMEVIAQLYTEINIDGRFACVGNNLWGLKRWYPVDKGDDTVGTNFPRIINDDNDDDIEDDEDPFEDEVFASDDEDDEKEEEDEEEVADDEFYEEAEDEEELDEELDDDEELDEELEDEDEFKDTDLEDEEK